MLETKEEDQISSTGTSEAGDSNVDIKIDPPKKRSTLSTKIRGKLSKTSSILSDRKKSSPRPSIPKSIKSIQTIKEEEETLQAKESIPYDNVKEENLLNIQGEEPKVQEEFGEIDDREPTPTDQDEQEIDEENPRELDNDEKSSEQNVEDDFSREEEDDLPTDGNNEPEKFGGIHLDEVWGSVGSLSTNDGDDGGGEDPDPATGVLANMPSKDEWMEMFKDACNAIISAVIFLMGPSADDVIMDAFFYTREIQKSMQSDSQDQQSSSENSENDLSEEESGSEDGSESTEEELRTAYESYRGSSFLSENGTTVGETSLCCGRKKKTAKVKKLEKIIQEQEKE